MTAQLEHMLDMVERPNVTVQVVPFDHGAHGAMTGPWFLMNFPEDDEERCSLYRKHDRDGKCRRLGRCGQARRSLAGYRRHRTISDVLGRYDRGDTKGSALTMTTQRTWRKSTRSNSESACVELSVATADTAVRDTKDRDGGTITLSPSAFAAFKRATKVRKPAPECY